MLAVDQIFLALEVLTMNTDAEILEDTIVPAGQPWSRRIVKGDVLRLIDLEGQQAIDFLCYNADDHDERYHAPNTIKIPGQIYLDKGSSLLSVRARKMMTIIDDTCGGHDTIFGCCSFALDEVRCGKTNPRCCQQNFEEELARHGLGPRDVVPNVNFFMRVPVAEDGHSQDPFWSLQIHRPIMNSFLKSVATADSPLEAMQYFDML